MTLSSQAVGCLCERLPPYVYDPPIEAVVFGWGVNEDRQLGLDTETNVLTPKVVEALLGTRFRGREFRRSPLVAGSRNTLAISADGDVYTWGWNARATLGHGHRDPCLKPRRVAALRGVAVSQVALGGWHCLALDINGQMYAWGGNEYAQCGLEEGSLRDITHPAKCLGQLKVRQIAAGGMHSLALTDSGQIWMWGEPWGDFSMTIDRTPRRIKAGDQHFVAIACGAFHNLALNQEGELFTWGINDFGQLGNGTTSYATEPQQVIEGLEGIKLADIAAGGWHSLAISTTGEVYVWGRGEYGRLGLGDKSGSSKLRPTKVKALEGLRIVEGSCGGTHTMVITDDGRAFIWGRGAFGRLGTGTERDQISPIEVKLPGGPERWRIITGAVGGRHSLVLAVPDNGDLHERSAVWSSISRRSPSALTPVGSVRSATAEQLAQWTLGDTAGEEGSGLHAGGGGGGGGGDLNVARGADEEEADDEAGLEESPEGGSSIDGSSLDAYPAGDGVGLGVEESHPGGILVVGEQSLLDGSWIAASNINNNNGASVNISGYGAAFDKEEEGEEEEEQEEQGGDSDSDDDEDDDEGVGTNGTNDIDAVEAQVQASLRVRGLRDDAPGDRA